MNKFISICLSTLHRLDETKIRKRKNFRNFVLLRFDCREIATNRLVENTYEWDLT